MLLLGVSQVLRTEYGGELGRLWKLAEQLSTLRRMLITRCRFCYCSSTSLGRSGNGNETFAIESRDANLGLYFCIRTGYRGIESCIGMASCMTLRTARPFRLAIYLQAACTSIWGALGGRPRPDMMNEQSPKIA